MLGQTLGMKKKKDMQTLLCNKNSLLQRGSIYTKKSKQSVGLAG